MPSHMSTLSTCMSAHMSICMSARQAGGVPVMNPDGISACQLRGIDCISQTTPCPPVTTNTPPINELKYY